MKAENPDVAVEKHATGCAAIRPKHRRLPRLGFVLALVVAGAFAQAPLGRPGMPLPALTSVTNFIDVDGDGDLDGIETNGKTPLGGRPTGAFLINDGHSRFERKFSTGLPPPGAYSDSRYAAADFDGDGFGDFLYVGFAFDPKGLYFGGPNLAFTPGTTPPLVDPGPGLPASFAPSVGDVDGDGDIDVLMTRYSMNGLLVPILLLNDGSGTFVLSAGGALTAQPAPTGSTNLIDLDSDGDLDVVLARTGFVATAPMVFYNDGLGGFTLAAVQPTIGGYTGQRPVFGDVDGDGYQDMIEWGVSVLAALALQVSMGQANGFAPPVATPSAEPGTPLMTFDIDGDGTAELASVEYDPTGVMLVVRTVSPAGIVGAVVGSFPVHHGDPWPVAVDLDSDGDTDVVSNDGAILVGDGAGSFTRRFDPGAADEFALQPDGVAGDVDGDGLLDLVGRQLTVAFGDGNGGFAITPGPGLPPPFGGPDAVLNRVLFDRDGDGDLDLYVVARTAAASADFVFDNDGHGAFATALVLPYSGDMDQPAQLIPLDVDLDGDLDIVRGNGQTFSVPPIATPVRLVANLGAGGFAAPIAIGTTTTGMRELLAADFDGDGDQDLLQLSGATSTLYQALPGGFAPLALAGFTGNFAAAGDLDFDGDADLVLDGRVRWSTPAGFTLGPVLPSGLSNTGLLADLDDDGDLDLIESPCTVMMNTGGGTFGPAEQIILRTPSSTTHVRRRPVAADVDQDGDLDVVDGFGRLCTNLSRQVLHFGPPVLGVPNALRIYGAPGAPWLLFAAPTTAFLPLPPFGVVLLDPATAVYVAADVTPFGPPLGRAFSTLPITVPNAPGLVGATIHWQAVDGGPARLTNRLTSVLLAH